jgi:3-phosphoshikimate 1-carboxyvinyltransferase
MIPTRSHEVTVRPASRLRGSLRVPGDKSISHRYAMLAGLADGRSTIRGFAPGADGASTLACLGDLGVEIRSSGDGLLTIIGRGLRGLQRPRHPLDAGNSGTTMRLIAGIVSAHPFETTVTGDSSLSRRPMRRIAEPLERMGARIVTRQGHPPLTITGGDLVGIDYDTPVPSAQVKSAILLAGLQAQGYTRVREPALTRDHTELALSAVGVQVDRDGRSVGLAGGQRVQPVDLKVPGDFSSAAIWAVAAASVPGSDIEIAGVGLNPTRTALLDVLRRAGADVDVIVEETAAGEPIGRLRVRHRDVAPLTIGPDEVPGLIDELPILAALATHGGEIIVSGASELRTKESDRITALVRGLRDLGVEADELPDGFHVRGANRPAGGTADAVGDHRMVMAFAIVALGASGPSRLAGTEAVAVSYPGFLEVLETVCG